jgi:conjugal transfer pilin signal peptidase TrbI
MNLRRSCLELSGHMRRRWYFYLPVFAIWALAYLRLFFDGTPRVPLVFNWTASLPYRVALLRPVRAPLKRGDLIVFMFAGEGARVYPGLAGQPFFKIVRGLPGDTISVSGREVRVNGEPVGTAKTHAFDRRQLEPIAPGVIEPGRYYVQGLSPDSFDSRYRESGLVRAEQVVGIAEPVF